jgi:hypothetical protein
MKIKRYNQINENLNKIESPFVTDIDKYDVELENIDIERNEYDYYDIDECLVYWDYELLTSRKGGIQSIIPKINNILLTIKIQMWVKGTEDDTDEVEKSYSFDNSYDIITENQHEYATIPYFPEEIEIDILNKKIVVKF